MTRSLRRTLAVRFAATMALGLVVASIAVYVFAHQVLAHPPSLSVPLVERQLILSLSAVVLLGSGATLIGAWQLAGSAVRPVVEITALATRIQPGALDHRIAAHADTDEYRELVAVLNGMLERLDRAFRNQRRLTADVSHELRTPLTALRGEIEVTLRSDRTPHEYQRVLRSALEEIESLTTMSEDLLLITRAEAQQLNVHRVPTHLNAVALRQVDHLRRQIEEKGLSVEVAPNGRTAAVSVDPDLVDRLVGHLVHNAVKFTPIDGSVKVTTLPLDGGVRLLVDDSGPGFVPEDLDHVFEPFYRADQARSRGTGSGLSLALVAAITRLHGGSIRAMNLPGGGGRVEVDFP